MKTLVLFFLIAALIMPASKRLQAQTNTFPAGGGGLTPITPKTNSWILTGNGGTIPGINFLGTTDSQSLRFKVNNKNAGLLATDGNIFFGLRSGNNNTGHSNIGIGSDALKDNTTGSNLVAIGDEALFNNGNGATEHSQGMCNTAIGSKSLYANSTGSDNTANGYAALYFNTTGFYNTANGMEALNSNNTGFENTAIGMQSLYSNSTGNNNTATGFTALYINTTGYLNTANGDGALYSNRTGYLNTANGGTSLYANSTGSDNTANGYAALYFNTTGFYNTANGMEALNSNNTGFENTAIGMQSLYSNSTGNNNTATGFAALYFNTTGYLNTANGDGALYSNRTGYLNTANGGTSLYANSTGSNNTANGVSALFLNTTGNGNTANGYHSLYSNTNGDHNTGLGYSADVLIPSLTNATAIGYHALADASNKVRVGNTNVTSIGGQVGWSTFSDGRYKKNIKEDVKGLSFINSLRPITYTVDINSLTAYFDNGRAHDSDYDKIQKNMQPSADEASKIVYSGFVAQDVESSAKKLNYDFSGVDKPKTKDGLYGLRYADFVVPLVKAVQELSKQNDEQKKINSDLQQQIDELKKMMANNRSSTTAQNVEPGSAARLNQNIPNPFSNSTTIDYYLPKNNGNAFINFYAQDGSVVKSVKLTANGKGTINVKTSELSSGAYRYALLIDGKLADSKQMQQVR